MAKYNSCAAVTFNSIDATCDESRASIKRVLVCPKEDIEAIGYQYTPTSSQYPNDDEFEKSTLINNLVLADNKKFVEFKFRRNTGSYTSTYTGDNTTGSQVVTTEVTLQFSKAENQKRLEFQKLTGHPCVMLIEDAYGKYIALGVDAPVVLTNTVMQSGTAKSDLSGFTLTFTEESNVFPPFVSDYDNYGDSGDSVLVDSLLMDEVFTHINLTNDSWDYNEQNQNFSVTGNGSILDFYQPKSTYLAVNQNMNGEFIYVTRDFVSNGSGHYEYTFSVEGYDGSNFSIWFFADESQGEYGILKTKGEVILDARAVRISYDAEISSDSVTLSNFKIEVQSTGLQ